MLILGLVRSLFEYITFVVLLIVILLGLAILTQLLKRWVVHRYGDD